MAIQIVHDRFCKGAFKFKWSKRRLLSVGSQTDAEQARAKVMSSAAAISVDSKLFSSVFSDVVDVTGLGFVA